MIAVLSFILKFVYHCFDIIVEMSYFPGVFVTQTHKSRNGYFLNHDLLLNGIY